MNKITNKAKLAEAMVNNMDQIMDTLQAIAEYEPSDIYSAANHKQWAQNVLDLLKPLPDIKPCPFCGFGHPALVDDGSHLWVECSDCEARGPAHYSDEDDNRPDAIREWNKGAK